MMHKKVKMPEVAMKESFDLSKNKKLLKKVIVVEPFQGPYKYLYDTDFEYADRDEEKPQAFLFIGENLPSNWKKYLKTRKTSKTLSAGECMLDEKGNLRLVSKAGKGDKSKVLLQVNKQLLKPFSKAYFVSDLTEGMANTLTDDDADADVDDADAGDATAEAASEQDSLTQRLKEKAAKVAELSKDVDFIKQNYDRELKEKLLKKTTKWLREYSLLDKTHQDQLLKHAEKAKKINNFVKKKIAVDNSINDKMDAILNSLETYIQLPEMNSAEAIGLSKQISRELSEVEKHANFVKDIDLQAECAEIRELLVI